MSRQATVQRAALSKAGMSLLEVILAIAVAGFVLAAAVSMLVSISSIWVDRAERHFFVDHVDGVTEFLNATFANAGVEIASGSSSDTSESQEDDGGNEDDSDGQTPEVEISTGNTTTTNDETNSTSGGLVQTADEPISWGHPPGYSESKDPLLSFKLRDAPPLLVGLDNAPLLGLNVSLYFEKTEGLSLLWYSSLQEETDNIRDLRRTPISSLVKQLEYVYWDERFEKWETESNPKEGDGADQYLLPRYIKLTFEYEGETQVRTFTIPVPTKSALIY